ncbi:MAG TPA: hypothetical protein VJJ98_12380 [Sedimentisphaerales bacterium]|nr:hypothetical protein [Sedimentisphaerales bacterium]
MPPRKKQQSNALLYTLVAFVGLFLAAATAAIIYYVKTEDYKTKEEALRTKISEIANSQEQTSLGAIIGTRQTPKTWVGTTVDCFDAAIALVTGQAPLDTHIQGKLSAAGAKVQAAFLLAKDYIDLTNADPNSTGLTTIIADLKAALDNATAAKTALGNQLTQLQQKYDDAMAATLEKEKLLQAEKDILQQEVNANTEDYKKLRELLEQTTDQQVKNALALLDQERASREKINQDLLKTQAQLTLTEDKMKRAQDQIAMIKPPPDGNAPAMTADGKVILADIHNNIVHIDKGSNDHVYPGLTFVVYDKNMPFPKDGKGKAEIEVFDVRNAVSAARILNPNTKKPILTDDPIANLIWDSDKKNVFVIAGQFDLDNKGGPDDDAIDRIKALIEKWGGRVDDAISVDTDFLVLGQRPQVLKKPPFEQTEIDPQAMEKFEASQRKRDEYNNTCALAQNLWIPTFSYDRFLYFTGYKQQSANAGAF